MTSQSMPPVGSKPAPEQSSGAVALRLKNVVKTYARSVTIGPVSLDVGAGEFISLLGPSGAGKTTLLRCVAGFETISEGAIELNGSDVSSLPAHRRNVGLVFQNYSLFPHLSVFNNVAFGLKLRHVAKAEIETRVASALAAVKLEGVEERRPSELSGGQQQRVAIARSLVLEPSILLLDEPLSNLDLKLRVQMRQELRNLQRRVGTTFIYVTHDQTEAMAMSDRIVVLSAGKVVQVGTPEDIYRRPATRFVADFIGGANLVSGRVVSLEPGRLQGSGGIPFDARLPAGAAIGDSVTVAIRAEDIGIVPDIADSHFAGTVISTTFLGDRYEVEVETADGTIVRANTATAAAPGSRVGLLVVSSSAAVAVLE